MTFLKKMQVCEWVKKVDLLSIDEGAGTQRTMHIHLKPLWHFQISPSVDIYGNNFYWGPEWLHSNVFYLSMPPNVAGKKQKMAIIWKETIAMAVLSVVPPQRL